MSLKVAVIGGGAAGFFAAISVKTHHPESQVDILERSGKTLSKVKVSGGGRCNVTHQCFEISKLVKNYPRGEKFLKKTFHQFNTHHTVKWFEERGVQLKAESDGRMFPVTDSSQTIIDCLERQVEKLGIRLKLQSAVAELKPNNESIVVVYSNGNSVSYDRVIVSTGGSPKLSGLLWLEKLGHQIETPVPSLFTFNMPGESIKELMGLVAQNVRVKIQGTKLSSKGPLLITHWGMSGPAILKLSAFGARELAERKYEFKFQVNWMGGKTEEDFRKELNDLLSRHQKSNIQNLKLGAIPKRLWNYLLEKSEVNLKTTVSEWGKKSRNKLINTLLNDEYQVKGKTTFKEEFVTCGGVSLKDVDPNTMQSRVVPNLYFAGEVLDIDGVTGGFNFQAAWTTGFVAGKMEM